MRRIQLARGLDHVRGLHSRPVHGGRAAGGDIAPIDDELIRPVQQVAGGREGEIEGRTRSHIERLGHAVRGWRARVVRGRYLQVTLGELCAIGDAGTGADRGAGVADFCDEAVVRAGEDDRVAANGVLRVIDVQVAAEICPDIGTGIYLKEAGVRPRVGVVGLDVGVEIGLIITSGKERNGERVVRVTNQGSECSTR